MAFLALLVDIAVKHQNLNSSSARKERIEACHLIINLIINLINAIDLIEAPPTFAICDGLELSNFVVGM